MRALLENHYVNARAASQYSPYARLLLESASAFHREAAERTALRCASSAGLPQFRSSKRDTPEGHSARELKQETQEQQHVSAILHNSKDAVHFARAGKDKMDGGDGFGMSESNFRGAMGGCAKRDPLRGLSARRAAPA